MDRNATLSRHRREIAVLLGRDVMKSLHQSNSFLDWLAILSVLNVFLINAYLLTVLPIGVLWSSLFILQGFTLQIFGLLAHECFTHRRVGGPYLSYALDLLFTIPVFGRPCLYKAFHERHHRFLNTEKDPEVQAIRALKDNSRWKRFLWLTLIGQIFSFVTLQGKMSAMVETSVKTRLEAILSYSFFIGMLIAVYFWPQPICYGYLLPLVIVSPIASVLRNILEHVDADPDNPIQLATFYKTNPVTKILFFFDSGDCHLIHHLFPMIPFYHMPRAITLMRGYLLEKGITEHKSFLALLHAFFIKNIPMRTAWKNYSS